VEKGDAYYFELSRSDLILRVESRFLPLAAGGKMAAPSRLLSQLSSPLLSHTTKNETFTIFTVTVHHFAQSESPNMSDDTVHLYSTT
jgi:hypothetical protein